jgi:hypothetical protein
MFTNTSLTRRVLGGVVGVNLALALAVSAGAVPRPGDNLNNAAATQVEELVVPTASQNDDIAALVAEETVPAPPDPTTTTAAPKTVAQPKVTTPPTTRAPRVAVAPKAAAAPAPAVAAAPAPAPAAAVVTGVARRVPTAAEIQGVITRLKKDIPMLTYFSITPAQVNDAGDQICTAFDSAQTFAQVKATGLSMIPSTIKVPAATADYAVRQAVAMYCPGHANKLV